MKKSIFSVRTIVAIGIGAAIFVLLGRFTSLPFGFIPNTQLEFTYSFLSLMAAIFGPLAGFFIGIIGHALKDAIMYGSPWWSWVIASGVVGGIMGFAFFKLKISEGVFGVKEIVTFNMFQIIGNVIAWVVVAPTLDILIYAEPANKVYAQGALACVSNMITVMIVGTILLAAYAKTRTKTGSLSKDE